MTTSQMEIKMGLSPRVRGNLVVGLDAAVGLWSIPACAGEPSRLKRVCRLRSVYPRVCGGTPVASARLRDTSYAGLSPRVRGNPTPAATSRPMAGSIPACAGEPP